MKLSYPRLSSIYVLDQDQALDFYVGVLGLEVGTDADLGFMRWLTVRVPGDDREILLERPGPPAHDPQTAEQVRELVAKGAAGGWIAFQVDDVDAVHADWSRRASRSPSRRPTSPTAGTWGCATPSATTCASAT